MMVKAHLGKYRVRDQRENALEMRRVNVYALGQRCEGYGLVDRVQKGPREEGGSEA